MYDVLTGRYSFPCPADGRDVRVALSTFRALERLPGAAHPAVYKVVFACGCGEEHEGLVTHADLDWAPLGVSDFSFFNVMTARLDPAADALLDLAAHRIRSGAWPWSFFCYAEERARPVFPSAFRLLAPGGDTVAVAVRCPACACTSVNVVTRTHVDVPFYNDRRVAVVEHVFAAGGEEIGAAFREELASRSLPARRRDLAA